MNTRKLRSCRACGRQYRPLNSLEKACSMECKLGLQHKENKQAEKRDDALRKLKLKTPTEWLDEAQVPVNAFCRERDWDQPCISCGRFHKGRWHAGHFLSRGSHPELRFHEDNIHKQCAPCNTDKGGNHHYYRINLIKKIGISRVEWLEGPHPAAKYTIDDAKSIKAIYKAKLKQLIEQREDVAA